MKKGIVAMVMCGILGMSVPVMADFDYSQLDSMTLEELESLQSKLDKKIADVKYETGEYPWKKLETYFDRNVYQLGDTWEVAGLWRLTFDSITETTEGIDSIKETPEALYLVTFTVENIGYTKDASGLKFWLGFDAAASDVDGELGKCYLENDVKIPGIGMPEQLPIGARSTSTEAIGVKHRGDVTVTVHKTGNEFDEHVAVFVLKVD